MHTQFFQNFKRLQDARLTSFLVIGLFLLTLIITMGFTAKNPVGSHPHPTPTAIPASGWTLSTPLPKPAAMYAFAQCSDQTVYVIGGRASKSKPVANVYRFDIVSGNWQSRAPLPIPLMGAAAACYEGKIYVLGGKTLNEEITASFYVYDINTNTWNGGLTSGAIAWGSALGAWDGKLYLAGGSYSGFDNPSSLVSVYDIEGNAWAPGGEIPCPAPLDELSCTTSFPGWVQAGQYLYLVGGYSGDAAQNVNTTMRLDMATLSWETGPTFQSARAGFALAVTPVYLYAIGGDTNGGSFYDPSLQVEILNLDNWPDGTWSTQDVPQLPLPLLFNSAGFDINGLLEREIIWSVGGLRQAGPGLLAVDFTLFTFGW